jgi:starvation-inducible DNA-binding protein
MLDGLPMIQERFMHHSRIDLSLTVRESMVVLLQARLADAVDLFTQIKQAHWNVKGPSFIALHELFDRIAEEVEGQGDALAERITAFGGTAFGTARAVATASGLPEYPSDASDGIAHVSAVADRLAAFGKAIRMAIDTATAIGDAGSADLFTEISRETDEQLWFVEAHLQAQR